MKTEDKLILMTMAFCACLLFFAFLYGITYKGKQNDLIEFRTQHAAILEDIIDDIYENDREYFDENIATSEHFDSLRSLYKDEFKRDPKQITWDDMYNY